MARAMVEQGGRFQAGDMRLFSRADGSISYTVICADFDDTECNSGASVADWENGQFIVEGIEPEHSEDCIALQEQRRQQRLHQQQLLMQLPSPGPTEDRPDPPTPPRASLQAEERRASSIPITNPAPAQSLPLPLPQRSQAQAVTHFPEGSTKSNQQIFDWRKNVAASSHSNGSPSWCGSQDEVVAPRDDDKVQIRDIQDASPTVQDKQAAISGQPRTPGSHAPLTLHEESTETRRISSEQRETSSTAHLPATSSSLHRKDHICVGNEYSTLLELEEHVMAWHEQKYPHRTPSQGVTRCSTLKTARTSLLCKLRRKQIASCPLRIAFRCKAGDVYWISEVWALPLNC